mmetsp:Transcript_16206/g.13780  ORF Transcript_16206/g.13780 Transcript_16206/m.13780 type:complete len:88 (-) Transcript_16206:1144-1407(-)
MLNTDYKKRIDWDELLNYKLPGDPYIPQKSSPSPEKSASDSDKKKEANNNNTATTNNTTNNKPSAGKPPSGGVKIDLNKVNTHVEKN